LSLKRGRCGDLLVHNYWGFFNGLDFKPSTRLMSSPSLIRTITFNKRPIKSFKIDLGLANLSQVKFRAYITLNNPQTEKLATNCSFTMPWERLRRELVIKLSRFLYLWSHRSFRKLVVR
jgi:hypothetical protein